MDSASSSKSQSVLMKHHAMIKKDEPKQAFRQAFAKWVVNEALPLCIGESSTFKEMIQVANWRMHTPDSKLLKKILMEKKQLAMIKIKIYTSRKHFLLTTSTASSSSSQLFCLATSMKVGPQSKKCKHS